MPLRRNTYKIHPLFVWLHAWCPEQTPQKQPHPHTMVWKLAPLAAPDVIQRPSTPQWAPPRPAIMPPLTSSGHSRGDCGTVQPEAEAHLEAHLNAHLSASREADNVEAGGRQDDRAADRLAARLLRAARTRYLHCRCGRTSVWSPGRGAAGAARHWYLVLVFPDLLMFRGQAGVRERPQRQRQPVACDSGRSGHDWSESRWIDAPRNRDCHCRRSGRR